MSLQTERILLESKINGLKRDRESKIMEGEMFVEQVRQELSPYLEFFEMNVEKANLAMLNIARLKRDIEEIGKDITALERKLR
jgi:hypothetical protein